MNKLIILAGLPGTGKSYYEKNYIKEKHITISSDETRIKITGSYDKMCPDMSVVYNKMIEDTNALFLEGNKTIVLDSTFLDEKRRTYFLDNIKNADYIELVLLKVSLDTVLERNHKRIKSKWVPEDVIREMATRFKRPCGEEKKRYNEIKEINFE
ncbi:MAG: ATP-binding protein [Acholeplasmatales bacterium]|nr:ATP-binding protein [Acholeplasmatales bacterium]